MDNSNIANNQQTNTFDKQPNLAPTIEARLAALESKPNASETTDTRLTLIEDEVIKLRAEHEAFVAKLATKIDRLL